MNVETIQSLEELEALAPEWRRLPLPTPMQSPEWLIAWQRAYADSVDQELCVLAMRDAVGRLAGLAPWRIERRPMIGATLRWIGDGRASTDHHTLLCEEADRDSVVDAAADWLVTHAGETWRRMRLEAVDEDDPTMNGLERRLIEAGLDSERVSDLGSFLAPLRDEQGEATWDGYLKLLSKNRRKKLRKLRREFFESGRASIRIVTTEEERQHWWPTLVRLHAERRQSMGEQGVFDCPRFNHFHEMASRDMLAEGRLYFAVLELDGEPVAVEYAPQDDQTIYAYQGGIAASALELGAGHASLLGLVDNAINSGHVRLDLLRGDEPYKLSWGATHRGASTLHVRPRTMAGAMERWASTAYRRLRDRKSNKAMAAQDV